MNYEESNIRQFYKLLSTIHNSDKFSENKKSVICVYDTFENDLLIGVFNNSKSCADFFKTNEHNIRFNMCRKKLRNWRYRLERVDLNGTN